VIKLVCVWCDHCNKPRHTWKTLETQWKTRKWKGSHEGRFNKAPTAQVTDSAFLNKEKIDQILKLLKANSGSSSAPNASVAQACNYKAFSCHSFTHSTPWIINTWASGQMTSMSNLYNPYSPCSGHERIRIANGSYCPIAGKSLKNLSKSIPLKGVLHVLNWLITCYPSANYPKIPIVGLLFFNRTIPFRIWTCGRWLAVLDKSMNSNFLMIKVLRMKELKNSFLSYFLVLLYIVSLLTDNTFKKYPLFL